MRRTDKGDAFHDPPTKLKGARQLVARHRKRWGLRLRKYSLILPSSRQKDVDDLLKSSTDPALPLCIA